MKKIATIFLALSLCLLCVQCRSERPEEKEDAAEAGNSQEVLLSLGEVAEILSCLPISGSQMEEVHDAVSSSSGNGYDEEYMMSDLFCCPGAGVGEDKDAATKAGRYSSPLRDLLTDYFEQRQSVKADGPSAEELIEYLRESDIQIYWPYSGQWTSEEALLLPVITFDPGYGAETNTGYELVCDEAGGRSVREIEVDEAVAQSRPVWVVNRNDDSAFTPADLYETKASEGGCGTLMLKSIKMLRNYDSWFGGASEFFFKCGSASGFKSNMSTDDLKLFSPSVTDFMVVVRRGQLKKDVEVNNILVSEFSDALDRLAFLIIEDDGGTTTSWKCSATVKYNSKSYGFDVEIPYKDKDDIVWRGQLAASYFLQQEEVTGRFGDVEVTFTIN